MLLTEICHGGIENDGGSFSNTIFVRDYRVCCHATWRRQAGKPAPLAARGVDGVTHFTTKTSINKVIAAMEYLAAQFPATSWRGGR